MSKANLHQSRLVPQVMVSSTFTDLKEHRAALIKAIHDFKLHANVMENDSARLVNVINSSLQMVRDSAAYICVISHKYGQTPECPIRNPKKLSLTELEFYEAQELGRPIFLFIMGESHPITKQDIERDPEKEVKLNAFRERAKKEAPGSEVNRVYATFNSLADFKEKFVSALSELKEALAADISARGAIPHPPAFYAVPDYIGSHKFVGRASQLQELSDWAKPADPTNILLFEAIGGNGKSMLTWEWAKNHAASARPDWAGRFWYSFYEQGATMTDFCQQAIAYMTVQPLEELRKKKTVELKDQLLAQLHDKPWLFILDGLERVLVAYNRIDAAEVPDEEVNVPTDKIANRNPCNAIRDEDNDLLRSFAATAPSKILVSSRLTPRVLLNAAGQAINGARRISLPGLLQLDAEKLLRSCGKKEDTDTGIEGNSAAIQGYLAAICDNHPLVIGIIGGLIMNYLPARGNFDAWVADPEGGAKLNLASLDLIARRNHILRAALADLSLTSRQLLSTIALLSEAVDYETLNAFNPHLPPEPEEVEESDLLSGELLDEETALSRKQSHAAILRWKRYKKAMQDRSMSTEFREAPKKLVATVTDLEQRGLLQYDGRTRRHDLHPVVRGVAAGRMEADEKEQYGMSVVDYFTSLPHRPYAQAEMLQDLRPGLNIVRTLLKLGHFQRAADTFRSDLGLALFTIEAHAETLSLLRPFFPAGWGDLPKTVEISDASYLAGSAATALDSCGEPMEAIAAYVATIYSSLAEKDWKEMGVRLGNISWSLRNQNLHTKALRVNDLALRLATISDDKEGLFMSLLCLFSAQTFFGQSAEAEATWQLLHPMVGRTWKRATYRPGGAELVYAQFQYRNGKLQEADLTNAERQAVEGKNRQAVRSLYSLRGDWHLERREWAQAAASYQEAVRLARERRLQDVVSETGLALAKRHLGQLENPHGEAERLSQSGQLALRRLAQLWHALGESERAKPYALAAYKWAWADGYPYVDRYEVTKTAELLQQLDVTIPDLAHYDPAKDEPFPWEAEVRAAIEKLCAEK